jgi:cell division protein FtsB
MHGLVSRIAIGVFGLLTIAMILLAVFDDRGALALREKREKRELLNEDLTTIEQQNDQLRNDIYDLKHDPQAVERHAREKLKLVKPDEIILVVPETTAPAEENAEKNTENPPAPSN